MQKRKFVVDDRAAAFLSTLTEPFSTLSIVGRYRSGKSLLLNKCFLENGTMVVGNTTASCTTGLRFFPQLQNLDGKPTLVFDSEGLNSVEKGRTHDLKVFTLSMLLSQTVIYNCVTAIDESAMSTLSLVTNLAKTIRVTKDGGDIGQIMPRLVVCVRDFALQMQDDKWTSHDYLQHVLDIKSSDRTKNNIRKTIKASFPHRTCVTLPRPVQEDKLLHKLNDIDDSKFTESFLKGLKTLKDTVSSGLAPRTIPNRGKTLQMNGPLLLEFARALCKALNTGSMPPIESTWQNILDRKAKKEYDEMKRGFIKNAEEIVMPLQPDMFVSKIREIVDSHMVQFQKNTDGGPSAKAYYKELEEHLGLIVAKYCNKNQTMYDKMISKTIKALLGKVEIEIINNPIKLPVVRKKYTTCGQDFTDGLEAQSVPYTTAFNAWMSNTNDWVWDIGCKAQKEGETSRQNLLKQLEDAQEDHKKALEEMEELAKANEDQANELSKTVTELGQISETLDKKEEQCANLTKEMELLHGTIQECNDSEGRCQMLLTDATAECDTLRSVQSKLMKDSLQIPILKEQLTIHKEKNNRTVKELKECRQINQKAMDQLQSKFLEVKQKHTKTSRHLEQRLKETKQEKETLSVKLEEYSILLEKRQEELKALQSRHKLEKEKVLALTKDLHIHKEANQKAFEAASKEHASVRNVLERKLGTCEEQKTTMKRKYEEIFEDHRNKRRKLIEESTKTSQIQIDFYKNQLLEKTSEVASFRTKCGELEENLRKQEYEHKLKMIQVQMK